MLAVCISLGACRQQQAGRAAASAQPPREAAEAGSATGPVPADTQQAVLLPAGWPLPELLPPPGSRSAKLPEPAPEGFGDERSIRGLPFNQGTIQEGSLWRVAFRYDQGLDAALGHLEHSLSPLGFYLYWSEEGRGREYISPDGRYIAQVYYWPEAQVYHLQVSVYREPWTRPQSVSRNS